MKAVVDATSPLYLGYVKLATSQAEMVESAKKATEKASKRTYELSQEHELLTVSYDELKRECELLRAEVAALMRARGDAA